jgi:methyl-accepting chemotaxis protein
MRSVTLTTCVASLVLAGGGCGGGDERPSPTEWATAFCTSTREWADEIERITDDVADLRSLTGELEEAVAAARETTNAYADELRALDPPDTESSEEIETAIEGLADELDAETAEIEDAFDDASGLSGPAAVGREVASSVAAMFTSLERTFESIEDADVEDLTQAFEDAEACDEMDL